uniref:MBD domain-containing protein n=1 Tax=Oryza meridionalis TaxID=40149 RepID=A0A0E0DB48_9ORYZ
MEVYRGDDGTICRYYKCPFSEITFTMKSEVLYYLFSEMDQRFLESKNCVVGNNLTRTHEWLPKGWLVEIRAGGDNMDKMYKRRHLQPPPPSMSLQRGLDNTRSNGDHRRLGRATDIVRDAAEAHRHCPLDAVAGMVTTLTDLRSSLVSGKDMAGCSNGPVREVSTTDGAGDMRGEPHVDAGGVEHMAAPGEEAELLAVVRELGEADRALERPMPGLHRPRCRFYVYPPDRVRLFSKDDVLLYIKEMKISEFDTDGQCNTSTQENILAILEFNPEGLPQGWVKEVVFRKTNTGKIRRDQHYTDPIKNYVFRTMRSAALYLETGKHESLRKKLNLRGTNQLRTQSSKLQKLSLKEEILSDEQGSSSAVALVAVLVTAIVGGFGYTVLEATLTVAVAGRG